MKYIKILLLLCVVAFGGCTDRSYSPADGLLSQLSNDNPDVAIAFLYDGVIEFSPASPRAGLVFYQGCYVDYVCYAPLMVQLAKQGFLCLLVRTPADMALMGTGYAHRLRKQYADMEHFYVGGHSLGGVSASMALGSHPDAFDGLLLLGSYSSTDLSSSGKRVVSVYGSLDGVLDREEYEKCRSNLPPDYQELVIDGGNHSYFGWYGHQDGDNPATITREEQIALTATFVSASL